MELDINPDWVSGAYFHDQPGRPTQGFRLYPVVPGQHGPAGPVAIAVLVEAGRLSRSDAPPPD